MLSWISTGLARGFRNKKLVLVLFLVSALPVLGWALVAAPVLMDGLADRPLADRLLDARILDTYFEYAGSDDFRLGPLLGAIPILMLVVWFLQVLAAAGYVPAMLGSNFRTPIPFAQGARLFFGRFLRSALAFGLVLAGLGLLFGGGMAASGALVEKTSNELVGLRFTALLYGIGFLIFAPLDMAYDLSRISAVAHDGRQTFRGYFRSLGWVLRRPIRLLPFYLPMTLLLLGAVALQFGLRSPWSPVTLGGIALLMLLRQSLMLVRCYFQLSFWGAEAACYEDLGAPDWCRGIKKLEREPVFQEPAGLGVTSPEVTQPELNDPAPVDPAPVDLNPSAPAPVDPAPRDPVPVDPSPADSAPQPREPRPNGTPTPTD